MADDPHPPLVGLSRLIAALDNAARSARAVRRDLEEPGLSPESGKEIRRRDLSAALKLAIARAEEVLG